MLVSRKSSLTGKIHEMELNVSKEDVHNYDVSIKKNVQKQFPMLSQKQQMFISSGLIPEECDRMLKIKNKQCG